MVLVVAAGCGSDADPRGDAAPSATAPTGSPSVAATPERATVTPEPELVATVEQSEVPLPSDESNAKSLSGAYTLRIPRIDVTAPVVPIQSSQDRTLVPPRDPGLVGWWSQGARPGADAGSAIVVGHTVRVGGGVFDNIGELRTGDTLTVEGDNSAVTYTVESVDVLSVEEVAGEAEEIFRQDGPGRLVLVTCENWDGTTWTSNIVAIATPT